MHTKNRQQNEILCKNRSKIIAIRAIKIWSETAVSHEKSPTVEKPSQELCALFTHIYILNLTHKIKLVSNKYTSLFTVSPAWLSANYRAPSGHSKILKWVLKHTHIRLMALCPGLPGWAGTKKVKPIWILLKQETVRQRMAVESAVCTSLQTDNHASTPLLSVYRLDALPAAQPTASKHWRQWVLMSIKTKYKFWHGTDYRPSGSIPSTDHS